MAVGEAKPFTGEPVDVRSLDPLGAVAADIAVAEVVRVDQDDVRLGGAEGGEEGKFEECEKHVPSSIATRRKTGKS